MSYKVTIRGPICKRIVAWHLPDPVFVEVLLQLDQVGIAPTMHLVRAMQPFDGMKFAFTMVDPTNRFRQFVFFFQYVYSQDEESLIVVNCRYTAIGL